MNKLLLPLALLSVMAGCNTSTPPPTTHSGTDSATTTDTLVTTIADTAIAIKSTINIDSLMQIAVPVAADKKYDVMASFAAGIPTNTKEYVTAESFTAFKKYQHFMDSAWKVVDRSRYIKMRNWAKTE